MSERVISFPFERTVDRLPNDGKLELIFLLAEYLPDPVMKRVIMLMRSPEVDMIDDQRATIAMGALNLRGA